MTPAQAAPPADGEMQPVWVGGDVTARATCVLAPNPGPMTLEGTNTWVLMEPGATDCVVVDPGPLDEQHLQRVLDVVALARGARVALTLLTHGHPDHAESAWRFAALTGAPVRAMGTGHDDLDQGERLTVGGLDLAVVATPGHTSDSLSFLVVAENALLTGDTILGRGTSVVAWPDGELAAYLVSLRRIEAMTEIARGDPDPAGPRLRRCRIQRPSCALLPSTIDQERLEQVQLPSHPVRSGAQMSRRGRDGLRRRSRVRLWPAARLSVLARAGIPACPPTTLAPGPRATEGMATASPARRLLDGLRGPHLSVADGDVRG